MTVLSIVTNDGWMIPYVACMIVAVGMLAHFMITLLRFLNRDGKTVPQKANSTGAGKPSAKRWITPVIAGVLVLVLGGYLARNAMPPKPGEDGFDFYRAGQIPIAFEGRVKPLDTLARNSMRMMSNRQEFKDHKGDKQPAIRWLFDLITRPEEADKHAVLRIDYPPLLNTLKLSKRKGHLYSYQEVELHIEEFRRQLRHAIESKSHDAYQRAIMELQRRMRVRDQLKLAFQTQSIAGSDKLFDIVRISAENQRLERLFADDNLTFPLFASQSTGQWERYGNISYRHQLSGLAQNYQAKSVYEFSARLLVDFMKSLAALKVQELRDIVSALARKNQMTFAETAIAEAENSRTPALKEVFTKLSQVSPREPNLNVVLLLSDDTMQALSLEAASQFMEGEGSASGKAALTQLVSRASEAISLAFAGQRLDEIKTEAPYEEIFAAYQAGDAKAFNAAVDGYFVGFEEDPPTDRDKPVDLERLKFEAFFNNASPFFYLAVVYLIAGLLAAVAWLACYQPLNRATFWLLVFALVVHTAALVGRIYISGRPPVTNLYSSAVFIGWGCVLIGLLFEWFYDIGIGNVVAASAGFLTLGVAHLLTTEVAASRGDTFTVLQAVLDTQFWLATHVVCISMGYAATYMAGLFGVLYILGGAFTPLLSAARRKDVLRMIYGTLCFAILFSFVGTVLGGLWADDSWGRFWGWDTKENGALIIVLWNAMVLHARWGGVVKERGLACLAVAGNIAVSWSWFGVNELGIGLHAYGRTEGVVFALSVVCVSQLMLIAVGCLPKQYWWSHIAEETQKAPRMNG